ncbi:MAG TPA: pilin [Candidatus Saccharimonadales bacterium]
MNRLLSLITSGALSLIFLLVPVFKTTSAFDLFGKSCTGQAASSPACQQAAQQGTNDPLSGPGGLINTAANIVALITGIAAVIMIILGGFMYITAAGNVERAAAGRRRIVYSLVAVIIVALAWTLTSFITDRFIQ